MDFSATICNGNFVHVRSCFMIVLSCDGPILCCFVLPCLVLSCLVSVSSSDLSLRRPCPLFLFPPSCTAAAFYNGCFRTLLGPNTWLAGAAALHWQCGHVPFYITIRSPSLLSVLPSLPFTLQARKQAESNFNQLQGNTDAFVQAFVQVLVEMFFVLYVPTH